LPSSTTVQVGGLGVGQRSSSSAYVTSLAAASAAERDRQVSYRSVDGNAIYLLFKEH
jgi:hypothetical protein